MTTTHTPGPWAVSAGSYGPEIQINGADGFGVALCADGVGDGVMERNARLIAAAPDLLKALRLLVIACTEDVAPDGYTTLEAPDRASMRDAIAAIEKAGGAA